MVEVLRDPLRIVVTSVFPGAISSAILSVKIQEDVRGAKTTGAVADVWIAWIDSFLKSAIGDISEYMR